jgi:hypothetical protein
MNEKKPIDPPIDGRIRLGYIEAALLDSAIPSFHRHQPGLNPGSAARTSDETHSQICRDDAGQTPASGTRPGVFFVTRDYIPLVGAMDAKQCAFQVRARLGEDVDAE